MLARGSKGSGCAGSAACCEGACGGQALPAADCRALAPLLTPAAAPASQGLDYVRRHNPIFWSAAPTKL